MKQLTIRTKSLGTLTGVVIGKTQQGLILSTGIRLIHITWADVITVF